MSNKNSLINGDLARAARALVQVNPMYIAQEAGLTRQQLRDFEKGIGDLTDTEKLTLQKVLENLGADFIADGEGGFGGYGVRRKFSAAKSEQIENWEGEGGPVGEDD